MMRMFFDEYSSHYSPRADRARQEIRLYLGRLISDYEGVVDILLFDDFGIIDVDRDIERSLRLVIMP